LNRIAENWIRILHLKEHPEGGYYVETYRSSNSLELETDESRDLFTEIYYLLVGHQFASFHVMKSDELWHFYSGSSITLHTIGHSGHFQEITLGKDIENDNVFQAVVTAGTWFAASVDDRESYSLVGCTVIPGFDFRDWKLGERKTLVKMYPQHKLIIEKYTNL
jgi:uncharacterized protein